MQIAGGTLNLRRATVAFLTAYITITILGTLLSFGIAAVWRLPPSTQPMQNKAYLLSEPFLPGLNLVVWMFCSWIYFRRTSESSARRADTLILGAFWLLVALPLDYMAFVLIKTPLSLSPFDFYVGQFPWIYLIYLAVFTAPFCYGELRRLSLRPLN